MVAFIIKLFFINSINNQVVINYYFNNNTFDTLPAGIAYIPIHKSEQKLYQLFFLFYYQKN
jgi:hypothetical protein